MKFTEMGLSPETLKSIQSLGFETLVHVRVDAKPVLSPDILESIPEPENAPAVGEGETVVVARLPAGTKVDEGQPLSLAVDLPQVKFFDPGTGRAL